VHRLNQSQSPILRNYDGGMIGPLMEDGSFFTSGSAPQKNSGNILANVTSIIGSLSSGVGSVFGAITAKNQNQMAQQAQAQRRGNNWILWGIGGVILLLVVVVLMRKK